MTGWKFDWQHGVLVAAFVMGLGDYAYNALHGSPLSVQSVLPVAMLAVTSVLSFFKNPPQSAAQALAEGEQK